MTSTRELRWPKWDVAVTEDKAVWLKLVVPRSTFGPVEVLLHPTEAAALATAIRRAAKAAL